MIWSTKCRLLYEVSKRDVEHTAYTVYSNGLNIPRTLYTVTMSIPRTLYTVMMSIPRTLYTVTMSIPRTLYTVTMSIPRTLYTVTMSIPRTHVYSDDEHTQDEVIVGDHAGLHTPTTDGWGKWRKLLSRKRRSQPLMGLSSIGIRCCGRWSTD